MLRERKLVMDGPDDLAKAKVAVAKACVSLTPKMTPPPDDQNAVAIYDQWSKMRSLSPVPLP